ncbi:MAG: head-tail adaptor protein [Alphaproteobacteria bacterium BRH_c36]|nr:MAG: head-tail adaptor protein [Alphaproteobacteria bacterium BRH_c36]
MNGTDDIRIGDLRQRIVIEQPVRVGDGGGGALESWTEVGEVWARLRPLGGTERSEADAIAGSVSHEAVMRYRGDLGPELRLRLGTRVFDIRAVFDIDERRRFLRCLIEERDL